MENTEIINLWKAYDKKLEASLSFNKQQAEDITKLKIGSYMSSMRPFKIFTIITGLVWVALVDFALIAGFSFASPFFLGSMGIQVLLTKIAIGVYIYQLVLMRQININAPILATQKKLATLRSSTIQVTRMLFLQFPVWTTFFWSSALLENVGTVGLIILFGITALFTFVAVWFFFNIRYENRNKKWFRLIFNGKEWTPVMKSFELLEQVKEYNQPTAG